MRASKFDYQRPESLAEALLALSSGEDRKALAGGHSLIPALNLRLAQPRGLVDIGRLPELRGIRLQDGFLRIGALSTHSEIARSPEVREHCAALTAACGAVGDPQVRSWGTLGGNLAHADPASDPPAVLLACEGTLLLRGGGGERRVTASDFFQGLFTTDLKPGELVVEIAIPSQSGRRSAYLKLPNPASRYAMVGVCVSLGMEGAACRSARIAVGGAVPSPLRCLGAEQALAGAVIDDSTLAKASEAAMGELGEDVMEDIHASAAYRRAMVGVYLKRAVRKALEG